MGFICSKCKQDIPFKKPHLFTTAIRNVTYIKKNTRSEYRNDRNDRNDRNGTSNSNNAGTYKGFEILKERLFCDSCFLSVENKKPEVGVDKVVEFSDVRKYNKFAGKRDRNPFGDESK